MIQAIGATVANDDVSGVTQWLIDLDARPCRADPRPRAWKENGRALVSLHEDALRVNGYPVTHYYPCSRNGFWRETVGDVREAVLHQGFRPLGEHFWFFFLEHPEFIPTWAREKTLVFLGTGIGPEERARVPVLVLEGGKRTPCTACVDGMWEKNASALILDPTEGVRWSSLSG